MVRWEFTNNYDAGDTGEMQEDSTDLTTNHHIIDV